MELERTLSGIVPLITALCAYGYVRSLCYWFFPVKRRQKPRPLHFLIPLIVAVYVGNITFTLLIPACISSHPFQ